MKTRSCVRSSQQQTTAAVARQARHATRSRHGMPRDASELVLGCFETSAPLRRHPPTTAVEVKDQHRHRRTKRRRLAARARAGGSHQRAGDRRGIRPSEHARLEIERIAGTHHAPHPTGVVARCRCHRAPWHMAASEQFAKRCRRWSEKRLASARRCDEVD